MREALAALAAIVVPITAYGQSPTPITTTPLLPPAVQPPVQQRPAQGAPQDNAPPSAPPSAPQSAPQSPPQTGWLPQSSALLQVLDKANAQNAVLTVKVGQSAEFGSLTIQVQACAVRPPNQPQDSTAYLMITDSHADQPGFRGWMLANNPSLSMLQHPIYDVRVVGCRI
jgi:hypothetical protein